MLTSSEQVFGGHFGAVAVPIVDIVEEKREFAAFALPAGADLGGVR